MLKLQMVNLHWGKDFFFLETKGYKHKYAKVRERVCAFFVFHYEDFFNILLLFILFDILYYP